MSASIHAFARSIAERLTAIEGVIAVSLGGSWARGTADANSDVDLGIYYDSDHRPSLTALNALAVELDDRHGAAGDVITPYGEWGQWIDGGGWLTINGRRVDWLYRNMARVTHFVDECAAGRPAIHYQAGHPFGFNTAIYIGEVFYTIPLVDPHGALAALKAKTMPYPPPLKQAMIRAMWEARFSLDTAQKSAGRGDVYHVTGSIFRAVSVMTQTLFALNERYWINEKKAVAMTAEFSRVPPDYAQRIGAILGTLGESAPQLEAALTECLALVTHVEALCADSANDPIWKAPPL